MLKVDSSTATWAGFLFLYGFGLGLGMQQSGMAAQTCLKRPDVMTGVALMFFFQTLGGSIFVSVGQVVFTNTLVKNLTALGTQIGVEGLSVSTIVNTGATQLRDIVPAENLEEVLVAYNAALMDVFKVGLACACATIVAALTMEWRSVKGMKHGGEPATPGKDVEKGNDTAAGETGITDQSESRGPVVESNANSNGKGDEREGLASAADSEKTFTEREAKEVKE